MSADKFRSQLSTIIEIFIKWYFLGSKTFKINSNLNKFNKILSPDNYEIERKTHFKGFIKKAKDMIWKL